MWEPGAAVGLINRLTNHYLHFFFSSYIDGNNIWLLREVRTTSCYWVVYCFHIITLIYILIRQGVQKVSLSWDCGSNFHTIDRLLNARNKKCKVKPVCVFLALSPSRIISAVSWRRMICSPWGWSIPAAFSRWILENMLTTQWHKPYTLFLWLLEYTGIACAGFWVACGSPGIIFGLGAAAEVLLQSDNFCFLVLHVNLASWKQMKGLQSIKGI